MTMATAPQDRLIVARAMRVAVGPDHEIVEVGPGEPWPAEAQGKLDVLIRQGRVIRFDEQGKLDKRSYRFARRLGFDVPPPYQTRSFLQRARALEQHLRLGDRLIRVYPGQPDGAKLELVIVDGRAHGLIRGRPDLSAAREALLVAAGGGLGEPRARREQPRKAAAETRRRRRRRKAPGK